MQTGKRKQAGSGIVETAAGLIFLIPVLFILIDVAALCVGQTANDQLAKQCARAAAEVPAAGGGQLAAASKSYNNFVNNSLCTKAGLFCPAVGVPNGPAGTITVRTDVIVKLPIPVPFGGPATQQFTAFATEPVVGDLP